MTPTQEQGDEEDEAKNLVTVQVFQLGSSVYTLCIYIYILYVYTVDMIYYILFYTDMNTQIDINIFFKLYIYIDLSIS